MTGAFSSGPRTAPRMPARTEPGLTQDSPLKGLQDRLSQLVDTKTNPGNPGPPVLAVPGHHVTDPQSVRSNSLSAIDKLTSMVKAKTAARQDTAARPAPGSPPKGTFTPGQKPVPTGPTAHEIMTTPKHQAALKDVIAQHEQANPGRSLKAPALMSLWNAKHKDDPSSHLNEARARSVVSKVKQAQQNYVQKQVSQYLRQGAKKAVT